MSKRRVVRWVNLGAALSTLALSACGKTTSSLAAGGDASAGGDAGGDAAADAGGDVSAVDGSTPEGAEAGLASLYRSGSRLKARYLDAGGGARKFEGWYDTKLASPCTFQLTEDGVMRCAPMADSVGAAVEYADSTCSEPISYLSGSTFEAPYFVTEVGRTYPTKCPKDLSDLNGQSVGVVVEVWRIGGPRAAPAASYFRYVGGACEMRWPPSGVHEVYSIEKVQPSELVAATTRVEPRGAALAVTVYEAEDGARMPGWLFDVNQLQPCTPSWVWTPSGDYRCYPSAPPRAPIDTSACGAASLCPGDLSIGYGASMCSPASLTRLSTCKPDDSIVSPVLTSDVLGTGVVKLVVTRAADDARPLFVNPPLWSALGRYRPGPFVDMTTGVPCDAVTVDGALRCVSHDVGRAETYADSACTQLVLQTSEQTSMGCDGAPAPATKPRLAIGGTPTRLYRVGNSTHLAQTWQLGPPPEKACQETQVPGDVYELAPEDASSLPPLTRGRD